MRVGVFHRIGEPNRETFTNSIEQILAFDGLVTFDGVYESVWDNRERLPELKGDVWLFFAGDTLGKEGFINKQQLLTLADEYQCLIGWHSYSHSDLTTLSDDDVKRELDAPEWVPRTAFAYPYGEFNQRLIELTRGAGYKKAFSTTQGDDHPFSLRREYI